MSDLTYTYCPRCATPLIEKYIHNAVRPSCPLCNFILFLEPKLVVVVVIQRENTVLLAKRNMEPALGMWSFIGGYVDRGEKVEDAALREAKEETNLDVQLHELLGVYSEQGYAHVVIAYRASIKYDDISHITAQLEEVSELAFFSLDCLPELAFPTDNHILHMLTEQR